MQIESPSEDEDYFDDALDMDDSDDDDAGDDDDDDAEDSAGDDDSDSEAAAAASSSQDKSCECQGTDALTCGPDVNSVRVQ